MDRGSRLRCKVTKNLARSHSSILRLGYHGFYRTRVLLSSSLRLAVTAFLFSISVALRIGVKPCLSGNNIVLQGTGFYCALRYAFEREPRCGLGVGLCHHSATLAGARLTILDMAA